MKNKIKKLTPSAGAEVILLGTIVVGGDLIVLKLNLLGNLFWDFPLKQGEKKV